MAEAFGAGWLRRCALLAVLVLAGTSGVAEPAAETVRPGVLTACLPRNAGVIAGKRTAGGAGFDYKVVEAVAARLGLLAKTVWFEHELEEESDPLRETYAMLAQGLCDVVPGHPLYVRAVGAPRFGRAKLPRWVGMPRRLSDETGYLEDQPAGFVDVRPIAVTRGYMRSAIGLAYREDTPEPRGLDDLRGRPLAFQQGTLSGALVMVQLAPQDRRTARHFNPGAAFLWEAERDGFELAIVDVAAFDSYAKSNAVTRMKLARWRHDFGMDLGFAVLEEKPGLLAALNGALDALLGTGRFDALAASEGLTYTPPENTGLATELTLNALMSRR